MIEVRIHAGRSLVALPPRLLLRLQDGVQLSAIGSPEPAAGDFHHFDVERLEALVDGANAGQAAGLDGNRYRATEERSSDDRGESAENDAGELFDLLPGHDGWKPTR